VALGANLHSSVLTNGSTLLTENPNTPLAEQAVETFGSAEVAQKTRQRFDAQLQEWQ
jgi:hypothetical protein